MSKFLVGSQYFFSCYDDFNSKDIDELELVETDQFKWYRQLSGKGRCLFQFRRQKETMDYINYALTSRCGMVIGKFLVPEFCKEIGMSINDLPKLHPLIEKLDNKHEYEEIIYNSYIENGSFELTEEQRARAYETYKKNRGE